MRIEASSQQENHFASSSLLFFFSHARALELDDEDILPTLVVKQEVAQLFKLHTSASSCGSPG